MRGGSAGYCVTDIFPDAVKIGMMANAELIRVIVQKLRQDGAKHIVVAPVMVAASGPRLMQSEALHTLKTELLPLAEVVTPDIPEAEVLSGLTIRTPEDIDAAARCIEESCCCAVLLKGGHGLNTADYLLYRNGATQWFAGRRTDNPNTHGTGCTLSSAIASNLA